MVPEKKTTDELKEALADEDRFSHSETCTVNLTGKRLNLRQAMHLLPKVVHVEPVKILKHAAAYFGHTVTDNIQVAVRLKNLESGEVRLDVTSKEGLLCEKLLGELKKAFDY